MFVLCSCSVRNAGTGSNHLQANAKKREYATCEGIMKSNKVDLICAFREKNHRDDESCRCGSNNRHKRRHQKGPSDAKRTSPSEAKNAAGPRSQTRHATAYALRSTCPACPRLTAALWHHSPCRWSGGGARAGASRQVAIGCSSFRG